MKAKVFWKRVDRRGPDDCWLWLGDRSGGRARVYDRARGKTTAAARVLKQIVGDPIPDDMHPHFRCGCCMCCNPAHVFAARGPYLAPGTASIKTLDDLYQRCRVAPGDDCWHWLGGKSGKAAKVPYTDPESGKPTSAQGARAALHLRKGTRIREARAWLTCCSEDCCNPAHATVGTTAQWGAHAKQAGRLKTAAKQAAAVAAGRSRAKASFAIASAIRAMSGTNREAGEAFGVSRQTACAIRRGQRWVKTANSVFSQMG